MIFATRSFHDIEGVPFRLFCNEFVRATERPGPFSIRVHLDGGEMCRAMLSAIRVGRRKLVTPKATTMEGDNLPPTHIGDDRIDFDVPANGRVVLSWEEGKR